MACAREFLRNSRMLSLHKNLKTKDFVVKSEVLSRRKIGKREFLNNDDTEGLMDSLNKYFEKQIEIPRMKVGNRQTLETLINEEALLLAKYLRHEKKDWVPRLVNL